MRALDALAARLLADKPPATVAVLPQGRGLAECLNPADLTQHQPGFTPIDV
jgi:hypothetical protein